MVVNAANLAETVGAAEESKKKNKNGLQWIGDKKETGAVGMTQAADFIKEKQRQDGSTDAIYEKPTKEVMQDVLDETMGTMDAKQRKDQMAVLSNTMTPKDYAKAEEDGFPVGKTDSAVLVTEIDKIKMTLAQSGKDVTCFGDAPDLEAIQSYLGDSGLAQQVANAMQHSDLPVTEENLKEIKDTLEQAQSLQNMEQGAVKYMLDNALEPTVQNLYIAQNSGSTYYPSYQESMQNMDGLEDSIQQVIKEAGLRDTDEIRADAQWMLENGIALTSENLTAMEQFKELSLPKQSEGVIAAAVQALAEGRKAQDAVLLPSYTLQAKAQDAVDIVYATTEEDIRYLIDYQQEVNLKNLKVAHTLQQEDVQEMGTPERNAAEDAVQQTIHFPMASKEEENPLEAGREENEGKGLEHAAENRAQTIQLQVITAQRQLAEVRLHMTVEANYSLLKQGISLDTKPLADLVDTLQEAEKHYYHSLLTENGVEANEENVAIFQETTECVEQLKSVPAYTLGRITIWEEETGRSQDAETIEWEPQKQQGDVQNGHTDTLRSATQKGLALQAELEQAKERYETMQTQVRTDLGDSMKKAFQNVTDILQELDLEPTEANARAVRILGYNHLDITPDSVQKMKAADQQVQNVLEEMKPAVVLHFIRKGKNPLDMDFGTLQDEAMQAQEELGDTGEERFSRFLYQLERKDGITQQERETYIGIYRLLHQVEQTDGAVIGALVHQGMPLTMRNLMTGVRSMKHSGRQYQIDDTSEQISASSDTKSITEQIEVSYQEGCLRNVTRKMTPDKLEQLQKDENWVDQTPEEVQEQMGQIEAGESEEEHKRTWTYEKQQLQRCMEAAQAPEEVYELLRQYGLVNTTEHVLAAQQMIKKRNTYQTFLEEAEKGDASGLEALKEKILAQFTDAQDTPTEWRKAQQNLADTAQQAMEVMLEREDVTHLDLQNLQMVTTQLQLASHMAKEERYEIPVWMEDEITNISVKIVRDKEQKGKVALYFETEQLGKVSAQLQVSDQGIRGFVATENPESAQMLEQNRETLEAAIGMDTPAKLTVLTAKPGRLSAFSLEKMTADTLQNSGAEDASVQTRTLYGMAEQAIKALRNVDRYAKAGNRKKV